MNKETKELICGYTQRIEYFRLKLGISRAELADRAGISRKTLDDWYGLRTVPRLSSLTKIAKALELKKRSQLLEDL